MRVVIRQAAYNDLDRIYAWIAKDQPRAADALTDRILESADRLGRFPYVGHSGRAPGTYEWVVPRLPYILVYQVQRNEGLVSIEGIFHAAQETSEGNA
jgi:toxin ParE1/3/4